MAKREKNKSKGALLLLLIAFVVVIATSLAFFSDVIIGAITGNVGTLDIEKVGQVSVVRHWTYMGPDGVRETSDTPGTYIANLNPGDIIEVRFSIENQGNKSAWLRNVINLTLAENHRGVVPTTEGMFEIYPLGTSRAAIRNNEVLSLDVSRIFQVDNEDIHGFRFEGGVPGMPLQIINGTGFGAETELGANVVNGPVEVGFLLYFRPNLRVGSITPEAMNEFQGMGMHLEILTQAMQYRNNQTPNWENVVETEFRLRRR